MTVLIADSKKTERTIRQNIRGITVKVKKQGITVNFKKTEMQRVTYRVKVKPVQKINY